MRRLKDVFEYVALVLFVIAISQMASSQQDPTQPKEGDAVRQYKVRCYSQEQVEAVKAKGATINLLRAILDDDEKEIVDVKKYELLEEQLKKLGYKKEREILAMVPPKKE